jgi:thiamine biosynthesis lipoprotein
MLTQFKKGHAMPQNFSARMGLLCAVMLAGAGLLASAENTGWFQASQERIQMGMPIHIKVWAADKQPAQAALAAAFQELDRIERVCSATRMDSELFQLNALAAQRTGPFTISPELLGLLAWGECLTSLTEGAFDTQVGGLLDVYGFRPSGAAFPYVPKAPLTRPILDPRHHRITFGQAGVRLDLGALAKIHALRQTQYVLNLKKVPAALIDMGGDIAFVGQKPDHLPWSIGVRHPRQKSRFWFSVTIENGIVLSSGDYRRFKKIQGRTIHHILDPRTQESAKHAQAATLYLDETADNLLPSIILMLLPSAQALYWVENSKGMECVILDSQGKTWISSGWKKRLTF